MFSRSNVSVWIGIVLLSGMFLMGQQSWPPQEDPCVTDPPGCVNGTCVTGVGTCDCDAGYEGELCDAFVPYNPIPAGRLDPTGCETYIGAHPVYPGELLCCSAPSMGSAPECGPGDVPDIPCVIEYEFCDDGTAMKAYSPDPVTGQPGHSVSTSGSWTVDPVTGELEIFTIADAMSGMIREITETYPLAFTYDGGAKLDIYSSAAVTIDEAGMGNYHRDAYSTALISGLWSATIDSHQNTDLDVTAAGYVSTFVQTNDCNPAGGYVCQSVPASEERTTSGTHTLPIDLYITPTGDKMYQTSEARTLVLERQPLGILE